MDAIAYTICSSAAGELLLVAKNGKIIHLSFFSEGDLLVLKRVRAEHPHGVESAKSFKKARLLLDRYLKGRRVDFDLDIDISDLGEFTKRVLEETRQIPYGQTRSYRWIAEKIGSPLAARAVGQALARNPIPIIIPCHRVIREDGSIGGFSLEGMTKEALLALEGVKSPPASGGGRSTK